jgi:MFS family permease
MSVNAMTLRLGQTLGPVVAGLMLQVGGLAGIYYGNAILSVATLGVVSVVVKKG